MLLRWQWNERGKEFKCESSSSFLEVHGFMIRTELTHHLSLLSLQSVYACIYIGENRVYIGVLGFWWLRGAAKIGKFVPTVAPSCRPWCHNYLYRTNPSQAVLVVAYCLDTHRVGRLTFVLVSWDSAMTTERKKFYDRNRCFLVFFYSEYHSYDTNPIGCHLHLVMWCMYWKEKGWCKLVIYLHA